MVYGFGGYATVNSLLLMMNEQSGSSGATPPAVEWRGFSGHSDGASAKNKAAQTDCVGARKCRVRGMHDKT
jgi:hypothetical protein